MPLDVACELYLANTELPWKVLSNDARVKRELSLAPTSGGWLISEIPAATDDMPAGEIISLAFCAKKLLLAATPGDTTALVVHEQQFCYWSPSRKKLLPLNAEALSRLNLRHPVEYRQQVAGKMSRERSFGLPDSLSNNLVKKRITPYLPLVELGALTNAVGDRRVLRGIIFPGPGESSQVYVEADKGVFYVADMATGSSARVFQRLTDPERIARYLEVAEPFRLVVQHNGFKPEIARLAKLLFDCNALLNVQRPLLQRIADTLRRLLTPQRFQWLLTQHLIPEGPFSTYEQYAAYCLSQGYTNDLEEFAKSIFTQERNQQRYFDFMKELVPDWKAITSRTDRERDAIAAVLNHLFPIKNGKDAVGDWQPFSKRSLLDTTLYEKMTRQLLGCNLAYAEVVDTQGNRTVCYSTSAGSNARKLRLPLPDEAVIDGVRYINAIKHVTLTPDPLFWTLPAIRHGDQLSVRMNTRETDSERLIASWIMREFSINTLRSIHLFTKLDTCRSCGSVVVPKLRVSYSDAAFSLTYLQPYAN
ncbi:deaminase domain-containing protein [Pseudomonas sp. R5(2019)]|uniref:deaminase domain-containing protein n=1 Tax=Pseudomonas sp. R5(2019) TaxID=2697566 RepID=UPI001412A9B5|nr:hypothetical protein [Pseudomonas sp. R5(2019)]